MLKVANSAIVVPIFKLFLFVPCRRTLYWSVYLSFCVFCLLFDVIRCEPACVHHLSCWSSQQMKYFNVNKCSWPNINLPSMYVFTIYLSVECKRCLWHCTITIIVRAFRLVLLLYNTAFVVDNLFLFSPLEFFVHCYNWETLCSFHSMMLHVKIWF